MEKSILLRLEEEDRAVIQAEAKKLGMTTSSFIRLLIKQYFNGIKFERRSEDAKRNIH